MISENCHNSLPSDCNHVSFHSRIQELCVRPELDLIDRHEVPSVNPFRQSFWREALSLSSCQKTQNQEPLRPSDALVRLIKPDSPPHIIAFCCSPITCAQNILEKALEALYLSLNLEGSIGHITLFLFFTSERLAFLWAHGSICAQSSAILSTPLRFPPKPSSRPCHVLNGQ